MDFKSDPFSALTSSSSCSKPNRTSQSRTEHLKRLNELRRESWRRSHLPSIQEYSMAPGPITAGVKSGSNTVTERSNTPGSISESHGVISKGSNGFHGQTGTYVTESPLSKCNITQADIVTDVPQMSGTSEDKMSHDFTVRPRKSREMRPTSLVLSSTISKQSTEPPAALQPTRRISSSTHL